MKKLCKVINNQTKQVEIGYEQYAEFYQSIGMSEMEVEHGWDGNWYLKGYAPQKPADVLAEEIRTQRDSLLAKTDKYMLPDYPIIDEEREQYKAYRQYLRDLPESAGFPNVAIQTFNEHKGA